MTGDDRSHFPQKLEREINESDDHEEGGRV